MSLAQHDERMLELPNGMRLCYSVHGEQGAPTVVLVVGLGLQLVYWPAALINAFVDAGLQVVCFDNRDAGRSARSNTPHPSQLQQLLGRAPKGAYTLDDMADDTSHLLEGLAIDQAHFVGMSMGGMIAQVMAYRHPEKVASLTSIFSTTGKRSLGQPAYSTLWRMARAKAPRNEQEAVERYAAMMSHIGDEHAPGATQQWQDYASLAWRRNGERSDARALFRQIGAILGSGDRTKHLTTVTAPSLVIHGDVDHMVHPTGGEATANAIPNAKHHVINGLRHQIDAHQSQRIAELVTQHIGEERL